jgi:hypothetical protein
MPVQPEIKTEQDHVAKARSYGAVCIKGKVEGRAAFPDQLILMEAGEFYWVEFKSATGTLQEDQIEMHGWLREKGHRVYVCKSMVESDSILCDEF